MIFMYKSISLCAALAILNGMNKKLLVVGGLLVIVAGAFTYVFLNKPAITAEKQEMITAQPPTTTAPSESVPAPTPGAYIVYTQDSIANTKGTKLLFFHAPWCPQCRMLDADIVAKGVPEGITIIKVDYDSNQALRQRYGVTIQTTVVRVDDSGNLIKKYVAYDDPTLAAVIREIL
jgi:thiol-disulfide isomerase/thioredoxin